MIEAEALTELVKALPKTRDLIIEEHMKLAKMIGIWYARKHRRQPDDLIGAANLGLVQAVQWSCEGRLRDHNITPYIVVTIHRFCREAIEADHTVVVARKARKHYLATIGNPVSRELVDDTAIEDSPDKNLLYGELMAMFCTRHRVVIELRLAGYTQVEISNKLSVSQPMVHKYLREIKERLSLMSDVALQLKELL